MQGNLADIGISLQAAKGTPATVAQHRLRLQGGNLGVVREVQDLVESTGDILIGDTFVANVRVEGAPSFVVRPNFIALLAYAALGAKATTGAVDPYSHALSLVTTPFALPWLTCWAQLADGMRIRATDCKVAMLRLESQAGGLVIATATIIGRIPIFRDTSAWATEVGAITAEAPNYFLHADGQGGLLVEGAAVSSLERCMFEINNGAQAQGGDSVTPDDITQARRTITVETTNIIADFALWNRLHYGSATPAAGATPTLSVMELAGSPAGIQWKYTKAGVTPERSLQIAVPRLQLVSLGGLDYNEAGEPLKQVANYRGLKPASGAGATITVKNGIATYPAL